MFHMPPSNGNGKQGISLLIIFNMLEYFCLQQVVQILVGEGAHPRGGGRHGGAHQPDELQEMNGYDAAAGYVDDLSRHKALAFAVDMDWTHHEHTPSTSLLKY